MLYGEWQYVRFDYRNVDEQTGQVTYTVEEGWLWVATNLREATAHQFTLYGNRDRMNPRKYEGCAIAGAAQPLVVAV
jgi:hypothetical protein